MIVRNNEMFNINYLKTRNVRVIYRTLSVVDRFFHVDITGLCIVTKAFYLLFGSVVLVQSPIGVIKYCINTLLFKNGIVLKRSSLLFNLIVTMAVNIGKSFDSCLCCLGFDSRRK